MSVTLVVGELVVVRGAEKIPLKFEPRGRDHVLLTFPDSAKVELLDDDEAVICAKRSDILRVPDVGVREKVPA